MNGLLLVLKQCFKTNGLLLQWFCPSALISHAATALPRWAARPGPTTGNSLESIVGAVSFPDTLTISCVVLADRYPD